MTTPDPVEHLAALGLGPDATVEQVEKAHKAKVRPLQKRASNAPEHLRDQAERDLAALEAATQALLAHLRSSAEGGAGAEAEVVPPAGHYAVLGVDRDATDEQVEAAFATRSRVPQHQSSVGTSPEVRQTAKRELTLLNEARQVLLDPARRRAHDQELAAGGPTGTPAAPPAVVPPERPPAGPAAPAEAAAPTRDDVPDAERLRNAERQFAAGDFPAVVRLLTPLLQRPEPDPVAARLLGLAAAREGQAEVALAALTHAQPHHPGDPETAATVVELLSALSRQGEAVAVAERAARQDPTERLAVTRAVLTALCMWRQPDAAARLAEQLLGPRREEPAASDCLVDVLLSACDAHRTQLADGRLVLATPGQCARVHELVTRLVALAPRTPEATARLRQLRVQLMDARKSVQWTSGDRWQPRTPTPPALVLRWGTP